MTLQQQTAVGRADVGDPFSDRMFVATVTPFTGDALEIAESEYRHLLRRFVGANGGEQRIGVIAAPEAGEIYYLDRSEKRRLLELTNEEAGDGVPVLMGVSENTTAATVEAAQEAVAMGVDGLFVMPPIGALDVTAAWDPVRYPEIFTDLLQAIAEAAPGVPMVCHPTGTPTAQFGVGLPAETAVHICRAVPSIVAWKMTYSYNGYRIVARALRGLDREVKLYASSAPFFHEYLAARLFDGTATGALNYGLDLMLEHIAAWRAGDLERARQLWDGGLAQLHEYVYADHARLHVRYKVATWLRGWIGSPRMRPPLPEPRRAEVTNLAQLLRACGVSVIGPDAIDQFVNDLPR
jgi:4-hydroxy-tetrahydrodipicolinate synthase